MPSKTEPASVNRNDLIQALESVEAGLSPSDTVAQSSRFVFRKGYVHTFNKELYCKARTNLPEDITCAVYGTPLLKAIRNVPDESVSVCLTGDSFKVIGKRDTVRVRADLEITLPYREIDRPGEWSRLKSEFSEGLLAVCESAAKRNESFMITCVHVTPDYVEATDRVNFARFRVKTRVPTECLAVADVFRKVANRHPEAVSQTGGWLHFKCGNGLTMTLRTDSQKFLDLGDRESLRGKSVQFPKAVAEVTSRLELFSGEYADDNEIEVRLSAGELILKGIGVSGDHTYRRQVKYEGKPVTFTVGPNTLSKLVERHSEIELVKEGDKTRLVARSGGLFYLANTGISKSQMNGVH